jgi:hypothetical protein
MMQSTTIAGSTNNNNINEREYPNLVSCNVIVRNENYNKDRPPVRLPADVLESYTKSGPNNKVVVTSRIPKPYDFALGMYVYSRWDGVPNDIFFQCLSKK